MNTGKNILICPLEWGLGHAGRMIPLAGKLKELGNRVIIGSGNARLALFRQELPGLEYILFPGFSPRYSRFLPQYLALLFRIPSLVFNSFSEHRRLKRIIRDYHIDLVISDNRFGLWNRNIRCVYVTHMPRIPFARAFRFLEWTGMLLHRWVMNKYSFCLIPDLPGEVNLTGRLTHGLRLPPNTLFAGILSRFDAQPAGGEKDSFPVPRTTLILSGPEPQKSILRDKFSAIFRTTGRPAVILGGNPEEGLLRSADGDMIFCSHLGSVEMGELIRGSELVISRPGYTTIMELISLGCSALLVPTPGQTEQEYLAEYLSSKGWFKTVQQGDIKEGISLSAGRPPDSADLMTESTKLLDLAVAEILHYPNQQGHSGKAGHESSPHLGGIVGI